MTSTVTAAVVPAEVQVLRPFVVAGVFDAGEVQLCATFARLQPGCTDEVLLALAVAARGPRRGHVCVELPDVATLIVDRRDEETLELPWPDLRRWEEALSGSALVAQPDGYLDQPVRPLVWDGRRLYLQRYFHDELTVAGDLARRARSDAAGHIPASADRADVAPGLEVVLDTLFGADDPAVPDLQRRAAHQALTGGLTIVAGGPGTGKTRTIARLLAAAHTLATHRGELVDVALAAPTGKAAGRMIEAIHLAVEEAETEGALDAPVAAALRETTATTLHRLLGAIPGAGFQRSSKHPLSHDLVVVDETSMVSLPLMSHLLDAVRPDATLVLVGDPFQLASIEAGSVMRDLVGPDGQPGLDGQPGPEARADPDVNPGARAEPDRPASDESHRHPLAGHVITLQRSHRFGNESDIAVLAAAVRGGDADGALEILTAGRPGATWIDNGDRTGVDDLRDTLVAMAVEVVAAAESGEVQAGLDAPREVKVLAATRHQPLGLYDWTRRIHAGIEQSIPAFRTTRAWYAGRPVVVTANDAPNHLSNGDAGLTVHRHGATVVAFPSSPDVRYVPTSRLDHVETWWGMTIHRSQGSEFAHAVVSLPPNPSPILTRELLYTAVTRARHQITVVGSEASIREAIARPVARASGLADRLWPDH